VGAVADRRGRLPAILLGVTIVGNARGSHIVG
jgi:hypothetical protein